MRVHKKVIERITIIGSMEEKSKILDYVYDNGYRITRSGPKRISLTRVDLGKYKLVAERERWS